MSAGKKTDEEAAHRARADYLKAEVGRLLRDASRVVVKVGSSTLTGGGGRLDKDYIRSLAAFLTGLRRRGLDVLLVTSGAVRAGQELLGLSDKPSTVPEKQAAAAVGQGELMHIYSEAFAAHGQLVAQVLLTRGDMADRRRYLNVRNAVSALLDAGVLPIANENDTVAVEELRFGDNDSLAALLAGLCEADLLLNLSDVDGLYTSDPRRDPGAVRLDIVDKITPEMAGMASGSGSEAGTGGMITKLEAARICAASGVTMIIAAGRELQALGSLIGPGLPGTVFLPGGGRLAGRKRWLAFSRRPRGRLVVNEGAAAAILNKGGSLLPVGITGVQDEFAAGDLVSIVQEDGREVGRGLTNYSSDEVRLVAGHRCRDMEALLGRASYEEVVHRDNLVLCP